MHGVKRNRVEPVRDSVEAERKKRDKQLELIREYTSLVSQLQSNIKAEDYSQDSFNLTTKVLEMNPEFHTGWSMRRTILLKNLLPSSNSTEVRQTLLEQDLGLTNRSLRMNPKNYSVWEHRKWVLETMHRAADWAFEIKMVESFLEKDGRNFHSWDYRRYLINSILSIASEPTPTGTGSDTTASLRVPEPLPTTESELAFTTRKISENFSNFSAWHYRTKLLTKLASDKGWNPIDCDDKDDDDSRRGDKGGEGQERRKRIDQEFDLVKQAIWSDPNDQSAWLYHRWLIGSGTVPVVRREVQGIEELLEEEPDSRWCLDSLVHYKRLLVKLLERDGEATRQEREELNVACDEMLRRLQVIDPMRANRRPSGGPDFVARTKGVLATTESALFCSVHFIARGPRHPPMDEPPPPRYSVLLGRIPTPPPSYGAEPRTLRNYVPDDDANRIKAHDARVAERRRLKLDGILGEVVNKRSDHLATSDKALLHEWSTDVVKGLSKPADENWNFYFDPNWDKIKKKIQSFTSPGIVLHRRSLPQHRLATMVKNGEVVKKYQVDQIISDLKLHSMYDGRIKQLRELINDVLAPARADLENGEFYKILAILLFISKDYHENNVKKRKPKTIATEHDRADFLERYPADEVLEKMGVPRVAHSLDHSSRLMTHRQRFIYPDCDL
ncbi:hypothetical protein JCM3766R1_006501 [Sporobolomyces carnicolor]